MDVSPETIRTVEFRERLRGYNQDDVDQFLERMAAGVEILQQRLRDASERAARAEERPAEPEGDDSLRRTLALAQRTADLAVEEAREQAARLVQSAQAEAHSVVSAAQGRADSIVAEAEQSAAQRTQQAQAQATGEVRRLQGLSETLSGEVAALERHLVDARARAHATLIDAARQLERAALDPTSAAMAPEDEVIVLPSPEALPAAEPDPRVDVPDATDLFLAEDSGPDAAVETPAPPANGAAVDGAPLQF